MQRYLCILITLISKITLKISNQFPIIGGIVYFLVHLSVSTFTMRIVSLIIITLVYNLLNYLLFYTRCITSSYLEFIKFIRYTENDEYHRIIMDTILKEKEFRTNSLIIDWMITIMVRILSLIFICPIKKFSFDNVEFVKIANFFVILHESINSDVKVQKVYSNNMKDTNKVYLNKKPSEIFYILESIFRKFLSLAPPAFPLTSTDYFWSLDSEKNKCEIIGLCVFTEEIELEELHELLETRWVPSDLKLRSSLINKHGRRCWQPKLFLPKCKFGKRKRTVFKNSFHESLYPDDETNQHIFDIRKHCYELELEKDESIHECVSKLASGKLRLDQEQVTWRMILLKNFNSDIKSCIIMQTHHSIGDGQAIIYSLLQNFFENCKESVLQIKRPDIYYKFAFVLIYGYHVLRTIIHGLRLVFFWGIFCPKPCAIFQSDNKLKSRAPVTGVKFLSPPVVLDIEQMDAFRSRIEQLFGFKPTVNDMLICLLVKAIERLSSGEAYSDILKKLENEYNLEAQESDENSDLLNSNFFENLEPKQRIEISNRNAGKNTQLLSAAFVCDGKPLSPPEIELSTPMNLLRTISEVDELLRINSSFENDMQNSINLDNSNIELVSDVKKSYTFPVNKFFNLETEISTEINWVGNEISCYLNHVKKSFLFLIRKIKIISIKLCSQISYIYTTLKNLKNGSFDETNDDNTNILHNLIESLGDRPLSRIYFASEFKNFVQLLVPVTTRLSIPSKLDNFTGPVLIRLPFFSLVKKHLSLKNSNHINVDYLTAFIHLFYVKLEMDKLKRKHYGYLFFVLVSLCSQVFSDCIANKIVNTLSNKMQIILTNVIGPRNDLYVCGKHVKNVQFWPPAKGEVSASLSVFTYKNQIRISSSFDESEFLSFISNHKLSDFQKTVLSQYFGNLLKMEFLLLDKYCIHISQIINT